jgi:glycine cleavage system aminomethyltransferase T
MRLTAAADEHRDVGWVTSGDYDPQIQRQIGLGFVKRGFNGPGTHLLALPSADPASSAGARIEVVSLPFV